MEVAFETALRLRSAPPQDERKKDWFTRRRGDAEMRRKEVGEGRGRGRKRTLALIQHQEQFERMRHPEQKFVVEVTASDEIVCQAPGQPEQRISMAELAAVYVETNDSGPWGADVWWLLNDRNGNTRVAFPQMATGEHAVLDRLHLLPGFKVNGMNSVENARSLCWPLSERWSG